jgi:hypothetical protein
MEDGGLTAKELARQIQEETGHKIDYRTIQNAALGVCSLDTYLILVAHFGWDFSDQITTPVIGASRIASLEKDIAHDRARIAGREAQLERLKAARRARVATHSGILRLVSEEDRPPVA